MRSVIRKRDVNDATSLQEYGDLPPNISASLALAPTTPQTDITEPIAVTGAAETDTSGTAAVSEEPQQGEEAPCIGGPEPLTEEDVDIDEDTDMPILFEADGTFVNLDGENNEETRGHVLGETADGNYAAFTDAGERVILSPEEVMNQFTRSETSALQEISAIIDIKWEQGTLLVRCTFDTGETNGYQRSRSSKITT